MGRYEIRFYDALDHVKVAVELTAADRHAAEHAAKLYLGDEISPDTCRLWDRETREKLDKDRFRRDLGGVEDAYQEVYRRLVGA